MQQNATGFSAFRWTKDKERAVYLVAEDRFTDQQIAAKLGIDRATLHRWKIHPEFAALVDETLKQIRDQVRTRGIAVLENRVAALDENWKLMRQVIAERQAAALDQHLHRERLIEGRAAAAERLRTIKERIESGDSEEGKRDFSEELYRATTRLYDLERELKAAAALHPGQDTGLLIRELKALGSGPDMQVTEVWRPDVPLLKEMRAHAEQAAKELGGMFARKMPEQGAGEDALDLLRKALGLGQPQSGITQGGNADGEPSSP